MTDAVVGRACCRPWSHRPSATRQQGAQVGAAPPALASSKTIANLCCQATVCARMIMCVCARARACVCVLIGVSACSCGLVHTMHAYTQHVLVHVHVVNPTRIVIARGTLQLACVECPTTTSFFLRKDKQLRSSCKNADDCQYQCFAELRCVDCGTHARKNCPRHSLRNSGNSRAPGQSMTLGWRQSGT